MGVGVGVGVGTVDGCTVIDLLCISSPPRGALGNRSNCRTDREQEGGRAGEALVCVLRWNEGVA